MLYKKNIDLTVKNWLLLTYQIKNMKLTLSIQSSCKNHVIQAYYQKIDFIEKTCPSYEEVDPKSTYGSR